MYKLRKLFGITSYELFRKKLLCVLDRDYNLWCALLPSECSFNWATENLLQFRQNSGYKIVLSTLHQVKERQKILEQKNVSYPWDQVCWFVFDASCIPPDQKCRELSVGTYSIHDNAVLCFRWILQGDGIQRHNRWQLGEKSGGGLGLVDPNSFPFFIRHYNSAVYYFVLFYQLNA